MDSKAELDKGSVAAAEQGVVTHSGVRCTEARRERSYLPEFLRGTKRNRAKANGRCDGLTCLSP